MFGLLSAKKPAIAIPSEVKLATWIIQHEPNRRVVLPRLECLMFLLSWKLAQANSAFKINCSWRHDCKKIICVALRPLLNKHSRFAISGDSQPAKTQVGIARPVNHGVPEHAVAMIQDYHRFLHGQTLTSLSTMALEAYPCRTTSPGQSFNLAERALDYQRSKRPR